MPKKIYLIDGNSFIYRMFFALPEFTTSSGKVVNALFGMAKFFTGQLVKENPDYIVFIKDAKGKNFRHDLYSDYKATREKMPDNLRSQISDIEKMISKMNMDIVEVSGYEADDVIATLALRLKEHSGNEIYILSGDKDLYALVDEQVKIYDTQKKKISGPEETFEKFGVPAECVRDYLAICGDSSDNIPGISGIGPKKAIVLLNEFGTLQKIYEIIYTIDENFNNISPESQKILKGKTLEKFIEGREDAFLSQKLATLDERVDLSDFSLEKYEFHAKDFQSSEVLEFFKENEFHSLTSNVSTSEKLRWSDIGKQVQIIGDLKGLKDLEKKIFSKNSHQVVLDTETTSLNPREAQIVGISLLLEENEIYYINVQHRGPKTGVYEVQKFLRKLLDSNLIIIGHNLKYDLQVIEVFLSNNGVSKVGIHKSQLESQLGGQTMLEL